MQNLLNIFLFSVAISVDLFAVSLSFGLNKTKFSLLSNIIVSLISAVSLALSFLISDIITGFLPSNVLSVIAFLVLFIIGIYKLTEKGGDVDVHVLGVTGSITLGISMSVDSLISGIGFAEGDMIITLILCFVMSILSAFFGNFIGRKISGIFKTTKSSIARIGGVILIILAFTKI